MSDKKLYSGMDVCNVRSSPTESVFRGVSVFQSLDGDPCRDSSRDFVITR